MMLVRVCVVFTHIEVHIFSKFTINIPCNIFFVSLEIRKVHIWHNNNKSHKQYAATLRTCIGLVTKGTIVCRTTSYFCPLQLPATPMSMTCTLLNAAVQMVYSSAS